MSFFRILAAGGITLLLAAGCSDLVLDPQTGLTSTAPDARVQSASAPLDGPIGPSGLACATEFMVTGEGEWFPVGDAAESRQGRNVKAVSYVAYNTEDRFVVEVTYEVVAGRSNAHAAIMIGIDGVERVFDDVAPGTTVTQAVELPSGWEGCDEVSYAIRQEALGKPVEFTGTYALVPVRQPVLWNGLGSAAEVANSRVGPGGRIVGTVNFDHDVQFGKGITPNTGYAGSGVDFPTTVLNPERGTVELWAQFYFDPQWYSHGVYGLVNANHWNHNPLSFTWYNGSAAGTRGYLEFAMQFNSGGPHVNLDPFEPELGVPVHLAVVWDREGIDGTGDYMRIYVDGEVAAVYAVSNDWGASSEPGTFRVATTWDGSFSTDRYSVDQLKVWDFARTDFSDRFVE